MSLYSEKWNELVPFLGEGSASVHQSRFVELLPFLSSLSNSEDVLSRSPLQLLLIRSYVRDECSLHDQFCSF